MIKTHFSIKDFAERSRTHRNKRIEQKFLDIIEATYLIESNKQIQIMIMSTGHRLTAHSVKLQLDNTAAIFIAIL